MPCEDDWALARRGMMLIVIVVACGLECDLQGNKWSAGQTVSPTLSLLSIFP